MIQKIIQFMLSGANRVRIGYSVAFLLLLVSLSITLFNVNKMVAKSQKVVHTNELVNGLESFLGSMRDAETGVRGYFITKDKEYLEPYHGSAARADSILKVIEVLVKEDVVHSKSTILVKHLMEQRNAELEAGLNMFNNNGNSINDSLEAIIFKGKQTMDSLRVKISDMQVQELGVLRLNSIELDKNRTFIQTINLASLIVSVVLAFYSFFTFNKENRARKTADEKALDYRRRLEERVLELRNANAELTMLRRSEKFAATGRIARTIAHEVRNPLTNINLAVEQIKEDIPEQKDDHHNLLNMINRNSSRINQLVTDLLDSTRFSELKYSKKSINRLLDEALEMALDRINLNQITLVKNYSSDICDVEVDAEKIKIAFLNIIVNALEAMETGNGILTIKTTTENDQCVTYIIDNGVGMDEEAQQKLFEPYFTSKPKGNGLGMTNTQNIILNHNGTIHVESAAGKGTTFIIALRFPQ